MTWAKSFRNLVLVCFGLTVFGPLAASADESGAALLPAPRGELTASVMDVQLHDGGTLVGAFYRGDGAAVEGSKVLLHQQGKVVAETVTNDRGHFYMQGLRGGVYEVETANGTGLCRLWSPNTAPPSAQQAIVLTANDDTVRGQQPRGNPRGSLTLFDPCSPTFQCLSLGLGAGGLAVGIVALKEAKKGS